MNKNKKWIKYINQTIKKENKGIKNKPSNPYFVELCKKSQKEMKDFLANELKKYYKNIISKDGFLFVKGTDKILLTAHMDTTKQTEKGIREKVKDVYEKVVDGKHEITSPEGIGGDDRCGIYVILKILETTNLRPYVLFNEDEEIGCVGSSKFAESKFIKDLEDLYFLVQIDRRGKDDAVFYQDVNEEFHNFVTESTGYVERTGSFTDICKLSPKCNVASVNLSSGYYNEHTSYEKVVLEELENTLEKTIKLVKDGLERKEKFEYKVRTYERYAYRSLYNLNSYDYDDRFEGDFYSKFSRRYRSQMKKILYITYIENEEEMEEMYEAEDENEAFVSFFIDHPTVCWNNITDYSYDYEEDYTSMFR